VPEIDRLRTGFAHDHIDRCPLHDAGAHEQVGATVAVDVAWPGDGVSGRGVTARAIDPEAHRSKP
jgi:hypothetical protein